MIVGPMSCFVSVKLLFLFFAASTRIPLLISKKPPQARDGTHIHKRLLTPQRYGWTWYCSLARTTSQVRRVGGKKKTLNVFTKWITTTSLLDRSLIVLNDCRRLCYHWCSQGARRNIMSWVDKETSEHWKIWLKPEAEIRGEKTSWLILRHRL